MTAPATPGPQPVDLDPFDAERVVGADGLLGVFNTAGILSAADVHAALRIGRLTGAADELAVLGAAFAVRAPRFGHVFAAIRQLADTVVDEDGRVVELPAETWPDPDEWIAAVAGSPLVGADGPLHIEDDRLYLDRYWRNEQAVADAIVGRVGSGGSAVELSADGGRALDTLLSANVEQNAAAHAALRTGLSVIAGGPGTGKTSTVARMVGVALAHARVDGSPVRIAIGAFTGKAAARLGEAIRQAAEAIDPALAADGTVDVDGALAITPTTLHRLLGSMGSRTRFRHHAGNPLPFDLVIVDEVSMVSLSMLARLLEAMRPDATLVLVGDPDQLAAVEAGTVLGDIMAAADGTPLAEQVTTLRTNYRSDKGISTFAQLIRAGDVDGALAAMARNPADPTAQAVSLVVPDRPGSWPHGTGTLAGVRGLLEPQVREAMRLGVSGDAEAALRTTMSAQVLCAHRRGVDGVTVWNAAVEGWAMDVPSYQRPEWYAGRPVMVSRNDYDLGVFNGDVGVAVETDGRLRVIIDGRDGAPIERRRLGSVQTVHAMTIHKSQGSEFDDVVVVLPTDPSPIVTRELLYTAVTRARRSVTVVATEDAVRRAISRPVTRASALPDRLRRALG